MDFVTVSHTRPERYNADLQSCSQAIPSMEETEIPEVPPTTILEKIASWLF